MYEDIYIHEEDEFILFNHIIYVIINYYNNEQYICNHNG